MNSYFYIFEPPDTVLRVHSDAIFFLHIYLYKFFIWIAIVNSQNCKTHQMTWAFVSILDALPVLLYKFSEQTLQPGPSVSLKCIAKGNPPPQIHWTRDGFPMPQDAR